MYRKVVLTVVFLLLLSLASTNAQDTWVARDSSARTSELKGAVLSSEAIYIATKTALYRTRDLKDKWESIFSLPSGGNNEITCLAGRARTLFLGTKRGLFKSEDYGGGWKNVFRTIWPDKNNITYIELSKHNRNRVLIATEKGIFISEDLGNKWDDISGVLKNASVRCAALNKEAMYAGAESGLYIRKKDSADWERIFIRSVGEKNETEETDDAAEIENELDGSIRCITINDSRVYIGYRKQVAYSVDSGKNWNAFSTNGLSGAINYLLISPKNKKMYCATDRGVFEFDGEKSLWLELYKGLAKRVDVKCLIFAGEDEKNILAVTDKGLLSFEGGDYLMDKYPDIDKSLKTLKIVLDGEPTYKELQRAAIKFCDVSPEKIRDWQRNSRIKALVPKVSLGMDNHRSTNSTIYTSATKDYVAVGPDDMYNALDVSVSWDLGNILYSDDQTNIDVRSRLMVQLRNDILDDLRRAYYERKRLQFELMTNPPKDMNAKFEKELRVQELTQAIDDLTGNYLSEHIKRGQAQKGV